MRLTLRTLLAYMDDILEPADHEDLGKKIEASDFATELIHRSRDTVRRLRLGAPAVLSDGSDDVLDGIDLGDANSVAEYLDNTLPPEQVAEFERMCLEPGNGPDMHLAEVASCHHVLTMVLGEPAEIDSMIKSRMYDLPSRAASGQKLRIEPAHSATQETPQAAPPVQAEVAVAAPQVQPASAFDNELPDYLREAAATKRRSRRWAIAITLLAVGAIGVWLANPPEPELPAGMANGEIESFDAGEIDIQGLDAAVSGEPTTDLMTNGEDAMAEAPAFVPGANQGNSGTEGELAPPFDPGNSAVAESEAARGMGDAASAEADSPESVVGEQSGVDAAIGMAVGEVVPELPVPELSAPELPVAASADAPPSIEVPAEELLASDPGVVEPSVTEPVAAAGTEDPVLIASVPTPPMSEAGPSTTEEPIVEPAVEPEPVGPQRLGNYLGNNDVLLIHSEAQDHWLRMPPRSSISTGDELLTLPKFFTHVVLADVNTYLSGGTRLRIPIEKFDAAATNAELNVDLIYGRMMLNAGLKGSQVAIQVDDQLREFRLEGSASLAVDVERVFEPGNDYTNQAAPTKATWYLTSGSVEWPTATGGTQTIQGQMTWQTSDGVDEIPVPIVKLPEWIGSEPMTDMERSARDDLAKELEPGQQVGIRLLELNNGKGLGRRKEVRVLAAAASVYVGEFQPLVKALGDSEQSRAWDTHIQDLRQAMALSPDVATSVRQAFVNIRGEEAANDLVEMVQGYNDQQIGETRDAVQAGALAQLLKWLDHDSLDYRVLAINNIREITGKTKGYRPDDTAKGRTKNLRKLWSDFESNELLPKYLGVLAR